MTTDQIQALLLEAKAYREMEEYPEALANLHQIVTEVPDNPEYLYLLGSTYLETHNTEKAEHYAEESLKINPEFKEAWELKGLIREAEKKYTEAEKCYLQCLELAPDFQHARFMLIQLYSNCFFPERITYCEKGYREFFNEPEKIVIQSNYLLSHMNVNLNKSKKKEIEKVSDIYGFTYRLLSIALYKLKKYKECIIALQDQINFISSYARIVPGFFIDQEINIYKLYYLLGEKEKAQEYLEKIRFHYTFEKDYQKNAREIKEEAEKGEIYL